MIKKIIKLLAFGLGGLFLILLIGYLFYSIKANRSASEYLTQLGPEAPLLVDEGESYRDLNKNGKRDVYENKNKPIDQRVEDLIQQMTVEEKAGSLFIDMIGVNADGTLMEKPSLTDPFSFIMASTSEMTIGKQMNHFNIRAAHPKEKMLEWYNALQKRGERSRLGIPITVASDPRHGVPTTFGASIYTPYFSKWPSALGFGAIDDSLLVQEHAKIVRQEYNAIGIKLALGPMADTATEPRWTRVNGTFGENAEVNARLTAAYIRGLQGDSIDTHSVLAMVKHFPGSGALDDGKDSHFPPGIQSYKGGQFDYHLKPFEAAFEAGVGSVMPYYSVPKGITQEEVAAGYNKEIITNLLRERYQFNGIICSDWGIITDKKMIGFLFKPASAYGVEELNTKERIQKIFDAGVDMIGGESVSQPLVEAIQSGMISEARIDQSLRRVMKEKFRLGLFDQPYLDKKDLEILSNPKSIALGVEAQKKSVVLLKNENNILPLDVKTKIHLYGFEPDYSSDFQNVSLKDADVIIAKIQTPKGEGVEAESLMQKMLEGGRLDYTQEQLNEFIPLFKSKPTIVVANLQRPAILTEIDQVAQALIADFDVSNEVILDLIFGNFKPSGTLPIQLPSSMQSVLDQLEDTPFDAEKALYEYGHGLNYN
ncbi:MAG: glycoside hydrolase family 3 N-terminal domain-containing protein [Flavobacteriaceae bacterium]